MDAALLEQARQSDANYRAAITRQIETLQAAAVGKRQMIAILEAGGVGDEAAYIAAGFGETENLAGLLRRSAQAHREMAELESRLRDLLIARCARVLKEQRGQG